MINQQWLLDRFTYNNSGQMFWKERPLSDFKNKRDCKAWNTRYAGTELGCVDKHSGYRVCGIGKRHQFVHRLIWLYHNGTMPSDYIDHINGCRADNRIENIRPVTSSESSKNIGMSRRNTSGVTGVSWFKKTQKWTASIASNGKTKRLGYFSTIEEAISVRKMAEREMGFHENHGRVGFPMERVN